MMDSEYIPSKEQLRYLPCVEHRYNSADKKLFGKNGFMWLSKTGIWGICIHNSRTANNLLARDGFRYQTGDEAVTYITQDQFSRYYKALKVPKDKQEQVSFASAFENRFKQKTPL